MCGTGVHMRYAPVEIATRGFVTVRSLAMLGEHRHVDQVAQFWLIHRLSRYAIRNTCKIRFVVVHDAATRR